MLALKIDQHGPISELSATEIPLPNLADGDVLVEVLAAGINPSDRLSATGGFSHAVLPRILGRDFAGRIVDGPKDFIGKEVWGSGGDLGVTRDGTHADYLVIPQNAVSIKPPQLSMEQAASVGVPFQTAWIALVQRGALKAGEWVVVSGATGAVGGAAIQIATALGAKVIALVRNSANDAHENLAKATAIAHIDNGDLPSMAKDLTGGKGVDLALNGVGESVVQMLLDSLREYGRMSLYSVLSGQFATVDLKQIYRNNYTINGVNTASVSVADSATILDKLAPMFESGKLIAPTIGTCYPLSKAAEAYQNKSDGKVVIVPDRYFTSSDSSPL